MNRDPGARNDQRADPGVRAVKRSTRAPPPGFLRRHPAHLLAFGFGLGLVPLAPGTFGSLLGVAIFLAVADLPPAGYLGLVIAAFVLGVWASSVATDHLGVHDHPGIVWDEVVGFLVTMIAAPEGWAWLAAGFVLFRLFDILKPWPLRRVDERVTGGLGIMLDDVLAGVYGAIVIQLSHLALKTA